MRSMWNLQNLEVFLSLTNLCNAACPQCNRTDPITLKDAPNIPKTDWSLEDFKRAFPPETLQYISRLVVCGTWGDPFMCKDILPISEYVINNSINTHLHFNTNGSYRSEDWWWKFGSLVQDRATVVFDIDGIDQEMHSRYRQKTFLKKILANMDILSNTPVEIRTQTIVFKHNIDYLNEIKQLCIEHGSTNHQSEISTRFYWKDGEPQVFEFANGQTLEYAKVKKEQKVVSSRGKTSKEKMTCVKCSWADDNIIAVNPDGQVWPCCFLATRDYEGRFKFGHNVNGYSDPTHTTMTDYNREDHNIFNHSLIDMIINSKYLNDRLPTDIKNNPYQACLKHCSVELGGHNVAQKIL